MWLWRHECYGQIWVSDQSYWFWFHSTYSEMNCETLWFFSSVYLVSNYNSSLFFQSCLIVLSPILGHFYSILPKTKITAKTSRNVDKIFLLQVIRKVSLMCSDEMKFSICRFCPRHGPEASQRNSLPPGDLLSVAEIMMPKLFWRFVQYLRRNSKPGEHWHLLVLRWKVPLLDYSVVH